MSTWSELPEKSKEDRKASVKRFRKNRKLRLLEFKGGMKCIKCGYDKPIPDVYEFHHRDPAEKDPNGGKMNVNNHRIETMMIELEKCDVLCANCHRETHALDRI